MPGEAVLKIVVSIEALYLDQDVDSVISILNTLVLPEP